MQDLASIWRSYVESAKHIQSLIAHTLIWSKEETAWFIEGLDEEGQIRNVLYTVVPEFIWEHEEMLKMAKQSFGVWPSSLRR